MPYFPLSRTKSDLGGNEVMGPLGPQARSSGKLSATRRAFRMHQIPPPPPESAPHPTPSRPPLLGRPKSPRLVVRRSVRLRREGGSLSITVPCHIVRQWKLKAGDRLVLRSSDEGILIYPHYFMPYSHRAWRARRAQARADREAAAQARAASQRSATSPISSTTCASVRPDDLRTWKLWSAPSSQCI